MKQGPEIRIDITALDGLLAHEVAHQLRQVADSIYKLFDRRATIDVCGGGTDDLLFVVAVKKTRREVWRPHDSATENQSAQK